jgi:hypothetical protein
MIDYIRTILLSGFIIVFIGSTIWRRRVSKKAAKWPSIEGTFESGKLDKWLVAAVRPK